MSLLFTAAALITGEYYRFFNRAAVKLNVFFFAADDGGCAGAVLAAQRRIGLDAGYCGGTTSSEAPFSLGLLRFASVGLKEIKKLRPFPTIKIPPVRSNSWARVVSWNRFYTLGKKNNPKETFSKMFTFTLGRRKRLKTSIHARRKKEKKS